jgi:hypothetical protein
MAPSCAADTGDDADVLAFLVEAAEELVDHPVGGELAVAACRNPASKNRPLALGHQHGGVIGDRP